MLDWISLQYYSSHILLNTRNRHRILIIIINSSHAYWIQIYEKLSAFGHYYNYKNYSYCFEYFMNIIIYIRIFIAYWIYWIYYEKSNTWNDIDMSRIIFRNPIIVQIYFTYVVCILLFPAHVPYSYVFNNLSRFYRYYYAYLFRSCLFVISLWVLLSRINSELLYLIASYACSRPPFTRLLGIPGPSTFYRFMYNMNFQILN